MTRVSREHPRANAACLAAVAAIALGLPGSAVVALHLFPKLPGQGVSAEHMACMAAGGVVSATLGAIVGRLIRGPEKESGQPGPTSTHEGP